MECMFCKKKEYYVMKVKCNHHVCLNCINNNKECKFCNELLLPPKKPAIKLDDVHWYDTMYDYDNGII